MFDRALLRLAGMKGALALLLVSAMMQAALIAAQTITLATALSALWNGADPSSQIPPLACFFACFAARRLVSVVQEEALDRFASKRSSELREGILAHALGRTTRLAASHGTAATALAATEGIDDIERYLRVIPAKLCGVIGISLPVLIALFAVDWVSGAITVVALPVIALFMTVLGKQARTRAAAQFSESARLANRFIDTMRGIDSIVALDAAEQAEASVFEASERMRTSTVRTLSVATLSSAMLDLITVFGVAAVAMMLAFRLMDATISLQPALAALMLAPEFFAPIRAFASDFHASLDGKNALAAAFRIVDSPLNEGSDNAVTAKAQWNAKSNLTIDGVSYSHAQDGFSLDDISFACTGTTRIGIVGPSGAGKSTLIDLLAGFKAADRGLTAIDGTPFDPSSVEWRGLLHYIPQNPHVFAASLEDNIKVYSPDASRDDVERAIDVVGLRNLVDELPDGLSTKVGEGSRNLSGGESQRIALARAFLDERPILLFDEPTAHLDIETEYELKQRMLPLMQGKLVFFATHRLHWLADMDYVIVLEGGTVAEAGNPRCLLEHNGALSAFIRSENGEAVA